MIVDNPSEDANKAVARHSTPLSAVALTPLTIKGLPRGIGHAALKKKWDAAEIEKKWDQSAFAQGRVRSAKRKGLNDFERFKVLRAQKQVGAEVSRELHRGGEQ